MEQVGHAVEMVAGPLLDPQPLVKVAPVDPHCAAGCLVVVCPAMLLLAELVGTLGHAMLGALLRAFPRQGARSLGKVAALVQWAPKTSPQQTLIYLGQMILQVQCTLPPGCFYI